MIKALIFLLLPINILAVELDLNADTTLLAEHKNRIRELLKVASNIRRCFISGQIDSVRNLVAILDREVDYRRFQVFNEDTEFRLRLMLSQLSIISRPDEIYDRFIYDWMSPARIKIYQYRKNGLLEDVDFASELRMYVLRHKKEYLDEMLPRLKSEEERAFLKLLLFPATDDEAAGGVTVESKAKTFLKAYPASACVGYVSGKILYRQRLLQILPVWTMWDGKEQENTFKKMENVLFEKLLEYCHFPMIRMVPALYSSEIQRIYQPRNIEELRKLLKMGPRAQASYFTLLPVFWKNTGRNNSADSKYELVYSLFSIGQDMDIGYEVFRDTMIVNGRGLLKGVPVDAQLSRLAVKAVDRIFQSKYWPEFWGFIKKQASRYPDDVNVEKDCDLKNSGLWVYRQASSYYINPAPRSMRDASFRINSAGLFFGEVSSSNDKLVFEFDLAREFPEVLFAAILSKRLRGVRIIEDKDISIQQSPYAMENNVFDLRRLLVIQLPGLKDSSIVLYSIKYHDRLAYDSLCYSNSKTPPNRGFPFSGDVFFRPSGENASWQLSLLRSSKGTGSTPMAVEAKNIQITNRDSLFLSSLGTRSGGGSCRLDWFEGAGPEASVSRFEPYSYVEPSVIRVSEAKGWTSLFGAARDSIFKIVGSPLKFGELSKQYRLSDEAIIYNISRFVFDSLRYAHISFGEHRMIPVSPTTLRESRTGDCKDFAAYVISELNKAGIPALPALVNRGWPDALNMRLPSIDAVNHMVVYLPKKKRWIDPQSYPVFASFTPEYLAGNNALVFYPESISRVQISDNEWSHYRHELVYHINLNEDSMVVVFREKTPTAKTAMLRTELPKIDSAKQIDFLFPAEKYFRRKPLVERRVSFSGVEADSGRIDIYRTFVVSKPIIKIGWQKTFFLPEMPLNWYVSLVSPQKRTGGLYMPGNHECMITITISGPRAGVKWPSSLNKLRFGQYIQIDQYSAGIVQMRFKVTKGFMELVQYEELKKEIENYQNFIMDPVVIR